MTEPRATKLSDQHRLPPVSRRALAARQPWRVLEARSFVYGLLLGYRVSLYDIQQRLKSQEAAFATQSGAGGNVLYQWARGESVPRRAQAVVTSGRRAWLEVIAEELPDVARRVGHPVWRALTNRLIRDPAIYPRLFGELPRQTVAIFVDGAGAFVRPQKVEVEALRETLAKTRTDLELADLFAAYSIWRRWRNQGLLFVRETAPPAQAVQADFVAAFARSSWICPDDVTCLEATFQRAVAADSYFNHLLTTERKAWNAAAPRVARPA